MKAALLFFIAWCISPPLSYGGLYRVLAIGCLACYALWIVRAANQRALVSGMTIIIVIGYMALLSLITGDGLTKRFGTYIALCMVLFSFYLIRKTTEEVFQFALLFFFALCIIWNITSIRHIRATPNVMRLLAKNSSVSQYFAQRGVGGYSYVYTVVTAIPVALHMVCTKQKKMLQMAALAFLATTYMVVFSSGYFMAMILAVFAVPMYLMEKGGKQRNRFFMRMILLFGLVVLYINADAILKWLISITDIRLIREKLQSVYELLLYDASISDSEFSTRYNRYMMDIRAIAQSPLFGGFTYYVSGNHSHFLDFAAQYGIPFTVLYLSVSYSPLKSAKAMKNPAGFTSIVIACIILMFNTIAFSMASVLYILVPITCKLSE